MSMARYLLDTNAWIVLLKDASTALNVRIANTPPHDIVLCSIVKFELWQGAKRYANREARFALLQSLFDQHRSVSFDDDAARIAARIRYELERRGEGIGPMDTLIASIAIANDMTLVSNNLREFKRIADLKAENWIA